MFLGEKKKNYNTLLFLTFIKSSFLLFLGEKKDQALNETFLYPYVVWPDTQFLFDFPGKDSHTLRNRKVL